MKKLHIFATDESPEIFFNLSTGILELSGKSLPEDIKAFYTPLEKAIVEYANKPQGLTVINMRLDYLNSASTKRILEIMVPFEQSIKNGFKVEVYWYYKEHDEEMMEEGEEFARLIEVPVKIICVRD
jgi:hypothetical protein